MAYVTWGDRRWWHIVEPERSDMYRRTYCDVPLGSLLGPTKTRSERDAFRDQLPVCIDCLDTWIAREADRSAEIRRALNRERDHLGYH